MDKLENRQMSSSAPEQSQNQTLKFDEGQLKKQARLSRYLADELASIEEMLQEYRPISQNTTPRSSRKSFNSDYDSSYMNQCVIKKEGGIKSVYTAMEPKGHKKMDLSNQSSQSAKH